MAWSARRARRRRASAPARRRGGSRCESPRRAAGVGAWLPSALLSRQPQAGEYLAPLGKVPVAERLCGDPPMRGPGATAKHAIVLAEEDFGVLAIGVGGEAGIGEEVRGGPLADLPHAREHGGLA